MLSRSGFQAVFLTSDKVRPDNLIITLNKVAKYNVVYDADIMESTSLIFHLDIGEMQTTYTLQTID